MNRHLAPSSALLVAANLMPLLGVIAWGWDAAAIVVFYWSENLIVGAITVLKMLHKHPIGGWFSSAFFTFHYGGFCAVHGFLVMGIFELEPTGGSDTTSWPFVLIFVELLVDVVRDMIAIAPAEWVWGMLALVVSHVGSLVFNYLGRGEYQTVTLNTLMSAPYKRVVVLHLAVLFGGWGALALGSPLWVLVLLVAVKTAADLGLHTREHRADATGDRPSPAAAPRSNPVL